MSNSMFFGDPNKKNAKKMAKLQTSKRQKINLERTKTRRTSDGGNVQGGTFYAYKEYPVKRLKEAPAPKFRSKTTKKTSLENTGKYLAKKEYIKKEGRKAYKGVKSEFKVKIGSKPSKTRKKF
jgi:hypothetical protein